MFEALIRRGTLMTVIAGVITTLGVVAAFTIPVQMIPNLDLREIQVRTTWPSATPQDIEKEILVEQEEYLRTIPSLQRLTSSASYGEARIELEFPYGIDVNETMIRVNNALSQVPDYPENVDQPRILAESFSDNSFMYFRVTPLEGNPRELDMDMMRDFIDDTIRARMESVAGVSSVEMWGGAERQVQILADPSALADRNMTVADLRAALVARNRDISAGEISSGKRRYLMRTTGRFDDIEELEELIVARSNDSVIRLHDVASVQLDHSKVRQEAFANGRPVQSLAVNREPGSNVIDIKDRMLAEIERINAEIANPAGMEIALNATDTIYVEQSIATVWRNLALGAVLATAVLFVFLRSGRATLVGILGIPICTIAAFIGLLLTGRTINVISLAGVAFAIGMTLDNSIVVLESIELERRRGLDRLRAASAGVRRVWPAVLASTLTTVLVFTPIVFIELEAGQLYSDIAIGISASILASMLVAITLVPTAAANLAIPARTRQRARTALHVTRAIGWLIATRVRRTVTIVAIAIASIGIILGLTPPAEYLPPGEEPKIFSRLYAPPGYNLETMTGIGHEIRDRLLPAMDHEPDAFSDGETDIPAISYMLTRIDANSMTIVSEPRRGRDVDELMQAFKREFRDHPGMRSFVARGSIINSSQGTTRSVDLDISGPDLSGVYAVASDIYRRSNEVFEDPGIEADPPTLTLSQPLLEIRPDWDRAAELGMDTDDIGFTVAALTDGAFADEFFLDDDKIDVYIYSENGPDASSLDRLDTLPIHTPGGGVVPLSSLARIHETVDTSTIRRVDGSRTVTLSVIPPESIALESAVETVREQVLEYLQEAGQIPAEVHVGISGASDQLDATREALSGNYVVALVLIYLVMVAIFTHWGYPLLIMTTIPLGVAGGIGGLWLLNQAGAALPLIGLDAVQQPFDMISMLGFLILMGTVVNNPILIVHRASNNLQEAGMTAADAVREAVDSRLRPIAMSAITTLCGLAPLVFLPGEGTEMYRGVGAIVMFGLAGAALVTLTFLPALTVTVLGWRERRAGPARQEPAT